MRLRFATPAPAALAAALLALPACKKKDDGPAGPGMSLPSEEKLTRQSTDNLKRIWQALTSHPNCNIAIGIYGPDGKTLGLSWRVAMLPRLGEEALYNEFKLNEPWDGPHNRTLIPRMPRVFLPPGADDYNGKTFYRSTGGKNGFMIPSRASGKPGEACCSSRMAWTATDGSANTALVVEAAEPVIWTKPDEIVLDDDKTIPSLGGVFREGTYMVMCDGSLNFLKRDAPAFMNRAMLTPAGGEIIPNEVWDRK